MAAPVLRPLSTGEVLDTSFGLYRSLFAPLLLIAVVCRSVPVILGIYLQEVSGASPLAIFDHWQLFLASTIVGTVLNVVAVAATTFMVSGAYLGQPMTADTALHKAVRLILPLTLLTFFMGLVIGVGLLLLIVPGLILFSGLVLATTALVLEQPLGATGAMGRSWDLTRGFRFKVFVSVFVAILLFTIPMMIVAVATSIGSLIGAWPQIVPEILTGLLQIFIYPFFYIVITVLYYDLRVRKEGFDLELLATATQPAA